MFTAEPDDPAAAAQLMPIPGERDVPVVVTIEPELIGELDQTEVWEDRKSGTVNPVVSTTLHSSSRIGCLGFLEMRGDSWRTLPKRVSRQCGRRWRHEKRS